MKLQTKKQEKYLQHTSKIFMFLICKKPIQINKKKTHNPIEKWPKNMNRGFLGEKNTTLD